MLSSNSVAAAGWRAFHPLAWCSPGADKTGAALAPVTILVVDDEQEPRWVTARMLRDEGYGVVEADSAHEALHRLRLAKNIRIVVADVAMPGLSGIQLAEIVSRNHPHVSVLLMSGFDSVLKQIAREPKFPLLMKPFTADYLAEQVRAALQGSRGRE
jgi:DNA-binding NtrC family response regulator